MLAPVALACIWAGRGAWVVLVGVLSAGMALEWVALCRQDAMTPSGAALPVLIVAAVGLTVAGHGWAALAMVALGFPLLWALTRRAMLGAGLLYIGPATVALLWLRAGAAGLGDVPFLILVVWASDIGAYLAGRSFGGPKLAPSVSPGKTWSGAVGGVVAAALVGVVAALLLPGPDGMARAALVAAALAVLSQIGDLLESAAKRHAGVKDSGRLIPGHGGLLDRLDGVLGAAPGAALLALTLGNGVHLWQ
jgi:phosphatidate cytidylyltransferase